MFKTSREFSYNFPFAYLIPVADMQMGDDLSLSFFTHVPFFYNVPPIGRDNGTIFFHDQRLVKLLDVQGRVIIFKF